MLNTVRIWSTPLLRGLWSMYPHTQPMGLRILYCLCFSYIDMLQHLLHSHKVWMWELSLWSLRIWRFG